MALMFHAGTISPAGTFYLRESDLSSPVVVDVAAPQSQGLAIETAPSQASGSDHTRPLSGASELRRQTPVAVASSAIASSITAWAARTSAGALLNLTEILGGAAAVAAVMLFLRYLAKQAELKAVQTRQNKGIAIALAEIAAKAHLLYIRHEQLTQPDFYGTRDLKSWDKEKTRFAETRLIPLLEEKGFGGSTAAIMPVLLSEIEAAVTRLVDAAAAPSNFGNSEAYRPGMDPVQYEMYCAHLLQTAGWVTRATPKTGDQGADIVAERRGVSLVVQCKLYSSHVGNGAEQEALAARAFHRTNLAVVVSNAAFTKSARQLAGMSDVALLHHSQLPAYGGRPGPTEVVDAAD